MISLTYKLQRVIPFICGGGAVAERRLALCLDEPVNGH